MKRFTLICLCSCLLLLISVGTASRLFAQQMPIALINSSFETFNSGVPTSWELLQSHAQGQFPGTVFPLHQLQVTATYPNPNGNFNYPLNPWDESSPIGAQNPSPASSNNKNFVELAAGTSYGLLGAGRCGPSAIANGVRGTLGNNQTVETGKSYVINFRAFVISKRDVPLNANEDNNFLHSPYGVVGVHFDNGYNTLKSPIVTKQIQSNQYFQPSYFGIGNPTYPAIPNNGNWQNITMVVTIPPLPVGTQNYDRIVIRALGNHLKLVVEDNGTGKSCEAFQDRIFIDNFKVQEAPSVKFTKSISAINGVPVTPGTPLFVYPGDVVKYTITAEAMTQPASIINFVDDVTNTALDVIPGSTIAPAGGNINLNINPTNKILTCTYNGTLTQGNTVAWSFSATVKPDSKGTTIRNCIKGFDLKDQNGDPAAVHPSSQLCADIPVTLCPPAVTVTASNNGIICQGASVTLTASGTGSFSWSSTAGPINSTSASPTVTPNATTTYTVTRTTPEGCVSTASVTVMVGAFADAGSDVTICQGSGTQLQATPGATTYVWSPTTGLSNPNIANPVANPTETTTYSVLVAIPGCTSSASVTVKVEPGCISAGQDLYVNENGGPIKLTGFSPAGGEWTGDGITDPAGVFDAMASGLPPGEYPLVYSVNNACGTLMAAINVTVLPDDGSGNFVCHRDYFVNDDANFRDPEIGEYGAEHIIDANDWGGEVIFDGVYHVIGSLRLTGGTFRMQPGTIFYVEGRSHVPDCPVEEYMNPDATYILLDGATLEMEGAAMRGTCEMWGGVILANNSIIRGQSAAGSLPDDIADANPDVPNCMNLKSEISDAFVGIIASYNTEGTSCLIDMPISNDNEYYVNNTNFFNNYIAFMDGERMQTAKDEGITNSFFQTYPEWMMAPLDSISPDDRWYGYQGMKLRGWDFDGVTFKNNRFDNLCEGVNIEGTKLALRHNTFTRNYQYGIRIYTRIGRVIGTAPDEIKVEDNIIVVPAEEVNNGHQLNLDSPVMGIFTSEYNLVYISLLRNTITGSDGHPNATSKIQYGIYNDLKTLTPPGGVLVADNDIRHQDIGIRMVHTLNSSYSPVYRHNYLGSNDVAIAVGRNLLTNAKAQITCNTIANTVGITNPRGIRIEPGAWLGNLGDDSKPNGNKFIGITQGMINDGFLLNPPFSGNNNFEYWRLNNIDDSWGNGTIIGNSGGFIRNSSVAPTLGFCRIASNNTSYNGANARVQGTNYAAILEMMDSLQYQVGTPADLMYYQSEILEYHKQQNLLAGLEAYVYTLPGQNLDAFNFFALALMEHYRKEGQEQQAQAWRTDLLGYNPLSHEIKFRVKYFDVMGRLGKHTTPPGYRFTVADSLDLSQISWSNTSHSEIACINLRFYRPKAACGTNNSNAQSRIANVTKPKAVKGSLGQSYPNPASMEATIPYDLNLGVKEAELRIYEVATGRIIQVVRLDVKAQRINLDLKPIRQGVYSYTLVEDGMPTATKKMVVLK